MCACACARYASCIHICWFAVPVCVNTPIPFADVTSDCGAVQDIYQYHNYTKNYTQAAADALNAGLDTECTWGGNIIKQNLPTAIQNGSVTKETARRALGRLFRVRMRLGEFDAADEQPYMKYGTDRIDTPAHRQLAVSGFLSVSACAHCVSDTPPVCTPPSKLLSSPQLDAAVKNSCLFLHAHARI